eukprot:gene13755-18448_t
MSSLKPSSFQLLNELIVEIESSIDHDIPEVKTVDNGGKKLTSNETNKQNKNKKGIDPTPTANTSQSASITVNSIDLRVGLIQKVVKHATAEKLYCEEIDVGEDAPRQIASGLVPYYTLEQMQGRRLIVVCNLKPRNLVGFKSHGMVLCAKKTNADGVDVVEFVDPPADAKPGDRIFGEGLSGEPLTANQCDKQKAFEVVAADLKVDEDGIATWNGIKLVTANGGLSIAPTLRSAAIS